MIKATKQPTKLPCVRVLCGSKFCISLRLAARLEFVTQKHNRYMTTITVRVLPDGHRYHSLVAFLRRDLYDFSTQPNDGKPLVMRSLPPASELEQALNLAQAEIRAMYKRLDIKGSNVLDKLDATLEAVQAAMPS